MITINEVEDICLEKKQFLKIANSGNKFIGIHIFHDNKKVKLLTFPMKSWTSDRLKQCINDELKTLNRFGYSFEPLEV